MFRTSLVAHRSRHRPYNCSNTGTSSTVLRLAGFESNEGDAVNEDEHKQEIRVAKIDSRREETDRAYAEIIKNERKERLEKTMRLRQMRLVTH
jgi:hypothetical protein